LKYHKLVIETLTTADFPQLFLTCRRPKSCREKADFAGREKFIQGFDMSLLRKPMFIRASFLCLIESS